jgi:hypothetical protein
MSREVLVMLGEGYTFDQILCEIPGSTYRHIAFAAREALANIEGTELDPGPAERPVRRRRLADVRIGYPRAFSKWTEVEDTLLVRLYRKGVLPEEIANRLQRRVLAIKARLVKHGLLREDDVPELKKLRERCG